MAHAQALPAEDLTADELVAKGSAAFDAQDFTAAERLLGQLVNDYGENPAVAPIVDKIRPLLAMCHVKSGAFSDALTLIDASLANQKLPAAAREELSFWRGICLLQTNDITAAQEQFGAYFADDRHDRTRRYEAFLLFGAGYIQLDDHAGAADFFADQIPKLPPDQREVSGRATVLQLHSLIQAGRRQAAVALVRRTFPLLEDLTQLVSFQLLTLQLGAECLDAGHAHLAITCLNRLWPRERLLAHQRGKLDEWRARRARLKAEGARREAIVFQIDGVLARIERELAEFEKIESYDAALRLRLAQAFMALQRWREAAMILDEATASLEPDKMVEQAALTALECWQQCGDDIRLLAAADRYLEIFGEHGRGDHVPDALFARGEALRGLQRMEEAEKTFGDLANEWPRHRLAPRAMLVGGICQLETSREEAALQTFEALRRRFRKGPLHEDAMFWEAMALSFAKRYDESRAALDASLKAYPDGRYAGDALFEKARTYHNQMRHADAVAVFREFRKRWPEHRNADESRLLLGESLMAMGEMDAGLRELRAIPPDEPRLREEALFKEGEALRKLERWEAVARHFAQFVRENPRSRRLAEAALWQARAAGRLGRPDEARTLAFDTILRLGDDPANEGVEDLLLGLERLWSGPDARSTLLPRLQKEAGTAREAGRRTLALRLDWARARFLLRNDPAAARDLCFGLRELVKPEDHHPAIIADCADAWRESGGFPVATELYQALRRWHPRAVEKERAALGLGLIAAAQARDDEALTWFDRCVAESVTGAAANDALLEKALILRNRGLPREAMPLLQKVTGSRLATSRHKARALLELGRCSILAGDHPGAARHFQRCYLSGARWKDCAAEAWLQHGRTLEHLKDPAAAADVYRGLLARNDMAALPPARAARERLAALEGSAP